MEGPSKSNTTKTSTNAIDEGQIEPTLFTILSESEGDEVTEQNRDICTPSLITVKKEKVDIEIGNRADSNRSSPSPSRQEANNDNDNCNNSKISRKRKRGLTSTAEVLKRVEPRLLLEQYVTERQNNTVLQLQSEVSQLKRELQEKDKLFQKAEKDNLETLRLAESHYKGKLLLEITKMLESDFNCCICNEVFIEPAVLTCGHTFCSYCINRALQQDVMCPVCRTGCNYSQPAKNVEMRNYITNLYTVLQEDVRMARDQVVKERNALPRIEVAPFEGRINGFQQRLIQAERMARELRESESARRTRISFRDLFSSSSDDEDQNERINYEPINQLQITPLATESESPASNYRRRMIALNCHRPRTIVGGVSSRSIEPTPSTSRRIPALEVVPIVDLVQRSRILSRPMVLGNQSSAVTRRGSGSILDAERNMERRPRTNSSDDDEIDILTSLREAGTSAMVATDPRRARRSGRYAFRFPDNVSNSNANNTSAGASNDVTSSGDGNIPTSTSSSRRGPF